MWRFSTAWNQIYVIITYKKTLARLCMTRRRPGVYVCMWAECDVDAVWSKSKDSHAPSRSWRSLDRPLLQIPSPPHCGDIIGLKGQHLGLNTESDTSLIISHRAADEAHQQSRQTRVWMTVECCLSPAKWTGWRPLEAQMKMTERAALRIWGAYPEKYSSKWGVPRLTVPSINMLTPSARSTASPALHIFLLAHRCELSPLSTRADTCLNSPGKWDHMHRCVLAVESGLSVSACLSFRLLSMRVSL